MSSPAYSRGIKKIAGGDTRATDERFTHAEAIERAHLWEDFNLFWFEEPLPAEDISGHAGLKAHTSIPIALGESLYNRQQFKDYIVADGVSIVQPDACRCGGITEWLKIAHMADCFGMQVSPHFVMELHLPLVAAIPNGLFVEDLKPLLAKNRTVYRQTDFSSASPANKIKKQRGSYTNYGWSPFPPGS